MAKKNVKTGQIAMLVAALLGIVAILLMFAPGVTVVPKIGKDSASWSGFQIMFGSSEKAGGITVETLKFNFVAFLALIFTIVGLVGVVLSLLLKGKLGGFLAIVGFLLAGIFFFLFKTVLSMNFENGKDVIKLIELGADIKLGVGAIIAGILSILAALASAAATFAFKK